MDDKIKMAVRPFENKLKLNWPQKVQVAVMSIFVAPIRVCLVVFFVTSAWCFAKIGLYGHDPRRPMSYWRNLIFRPLVVNCCRLMFAGGGFYWAKFVGERVSSSKAPILVIAPHSTFFDALIIVKLGLTTVVAKSGAANVPLFGTLLQFCQAIFVDREDPNSRHNTVQTMKDRSATGGEWPQIAIFPEGTCTNRSCILKYKSGAFLPGVPVQPVVVRYPNELDTYSWTWRGIGVWKIFWLTLCQPFSRFEMHFLPVHNPTEEERSNPVLYGNNVRREMAEALKVPTSEYSVDDCLLMDYSDHLIDHGILLAENFVQFRFYFRKIEELAGENLFESVFPTFQKNYSSNSQISKEELIKILKITSETSKENFLYALLTIGEKESNINWRKFFTVVSFSTYPYNMKKSLHLLLSTYKEKLEPITGETILYFFIEVLNASPELSQFLVNIFKKENIYKEGK